MDRHDPWPSQGQIKKGRHDTVEWDLLVLDEQPKVKKLKNKISQELLSLRLTILSFKQLFNLFTQISNSSIPFL